MGSITIKNNVKNNAQSYDQHNILHFGSKHIIVQTTSSWQLTPRILFKGYHLKG